ncbi:hypothetical protein [Xenorhabdus sp. KJ12.1]
MTAIVSAKIPTLPSDEVWRSVKNTTIEFKP